MMAQWLALRPHSARDSGSIPALGDCAESAPSPCVCMGFLRMPQFPPTLKDVWVRWIDVLNCPLVTERLAG